MRKEIFPMKSNTPPNFTYHFKKIFHKVSRFFEKGSYSIVKIGKNIKAHDVYLFDSEANDIIINYFKKNFKNSARIISEEGEEIFIGTGDPEFTVVIDPVDGSVNVNRGLNIFSCGIAVLRGLQPLTIDSVISSMVGNFLVKELYIAQKGSGAYCSKKIITGSMSNDPKTFIISIELSHLLSESFPQLLDILSEVHQVRSLGSAITAFSLVASGRLDAHIDIRDRLTIENILPASLLIKEAGGILTDPNGNELKPATDLKQPFNIVASGNPTIHTWILNKIRHHK
jgi:myo-inositol-1(or 4)-monophosphatase